MSVLRPSWNAREAQRTGIGLRQALQRRWRRHDAHHADVADGNPTSYERLQTGAQRTTCTRRPSRAAPGSDSEPLALTRSEHGVGDEHTRVGLEGIGQLVQVHCGLQRVLVARHAFNGNGRSAHLASKHAALGTHRSDKSPALAAPSPPALAGRGQHGGWARMPLASSGPQTPPQPCRAACPPRQTT